MKKLVNFKINIGPYEFREHLFCPVESDEQEMASKFFGETPPGEKQGDGFVFENAPGSPVVTVVSVLEVEDQMAEMVDSIVRA